MTEVTELSNGSFYHHSSEDCSGKECAIHSPPNNLSRDWPLRWNTEKEQMQRRCSHDLWHLAEYPGTVKGSHDCDDCCIRAVRNLDGI